ncbi:2OG-Fe(II) oxygenase [Erythrobacter sp. HL-111]|uniref:prolyl hydroxylase family protein n=1 Tax=Erythrobacter sp. HL-111 TaxID=1798193 RepID=UPI0006DABC3C|nr:2OG-Fe(II) oxygenase [Erythrobacter sp. HL-111]KPP96208.1 MAG: prolyl 4-hydroxylase [Erythrobacteraceae bacterium HL-111]SDR77973.1 prolyl 4-hydroxylase [Erythrobacter sp. HL-111]
MQTSADSVRPAELAARLAAHPRVQRVPTPKAELFQHRDFLSPDLRRALIALIDQDRRPSTIADDNGDAYFRTSETCDLDPAEPAVRELEALLFDLNGIDPRFGEPCQGQRYAVGQEFKAHTDYFTPGGPDYDKFCAVAGQRTWTFMIYLNQVEAGGATRFRAIGKTFHPEPGKLLCWNNARSDGRVNPNTLHHGMKVRKGVKYVITKWYRERPWG